VDGKKHTADEIRTQVIKARLSNKVEVADMLEAYEAMVALEEQIHPLEKEALARTENEQDHILDAMRRILDGTDPEWENVPVRRAEFVSFIGAYEAQHHAAVWSKNKALMDSKAAMAEIRRELDEFQRKVEHVADLKSQLAMREAEVRHYKAAVKALPQEYLIEVNRAIMEARTKEYHAAQAATSEVKPPEPADSTK